MEINDIIGKQRHNPLTQQQLMSSTEINILYIGRVEDNTYSL